MQAKKKTIDAKKLADLGSDTTLTTKYSKFELPPARSGSVTFVESVDELLQKLRSEKKAI
jgi:electron transfer flavoprotein alpha/beta subunit